MSGLCKNYNLDLSSMHCKGYKALLETENSKFHQNTLSRFGDKIRGLTDTNSAFCVRFIDFTYRLYTKHTLQEILIHQHIT